MTRPPALVKGENKWRHLTSTPSKLPKPLQKKPINFKLQAQNNASIETKPALKQNPGQLGHRIHQVALHWKQWAKASAQSRMASQHARLRVQKWIWRVWTAKCKQIDSNLWKDEIRADVHLRYQRLKRACQIWRVKMNTRQSLRSKEILAKRQGLLFYEF